MGNVLLYLNFSLSYPLPMCYMWHSRGKQAGAIAPPVSRSTRYFLGRIVRLSSLVVQFCRTFFTLLGFLSDPGIIHCLLRPLYFSQL